jgi:CubicO group peptidase (beta-lactamase class C family)
MGAFLWSHPWRTVLGLGAAATLIMVTSSAGPVLTPSDKVPTAVSRTAEEPSRQSEPEAASGGGEQSEEIEKILQSSLSRYSLAALIVRVTQDGKVVYEGAAGESMTGVPATPQMHFRNGAMAFTYMASILLRSVDDQKLHLHDKLSQYFPDLPHADQVTVKMLANMTAGYADYVYQPEILEGTYRNPFQQWTTDQLIRIGTSKPMMFEPGTNWGYSHTDYAILARVLEKASGVSMDQLMRTYIIDPLKLGQTQSLSTPVVPEPVLHSFTSERRQILDIPAGTPFYEESTFWNPSWTTAGGAVQVTGIADLATSITAVGAGTLLSSASHSAQVSPELVGFGKAVEGCPACRTNTEQASYGLGVVLRGPWITQNALFSGASSSAGYLPSEKLTIAVATTYASGAFDAEGNYVEADGAVLADIAKKLVPGQPVPLPEQ